MDIAIATLDIGHKSRIGRSLVPSESLSVTVLGSEFQVDGAEQQNGRLASAVLLRLYSLIMHVSVAWNVSSVSSVSERPSAAS